MTRESYSRVRKIELRCFYNAKTLIIISLLSVALNAGANKDFDDCISINKSTDHKIVNKRGADAETRTLFKKTQKECNEETSTERNIKHESVCKNCMKEQQSYYRKLQASGRVETTNKNIVEEWKAYCKLEADTKVSHNKGHQVRLHGVIDPKVAKTKGGLVSDINQAKVCWVKNPPPSCNQK